MNRYFEEGEVFTWHRDRDREEENLVIALKMVKENYRNGNKQAMIAEDIRTGKKYFVKVRAYKTVAKSKVYGAYSAVRSCKVK